MPRQLSLDRAIDRVAKAILEREGRALIVGSSFWSTQSPDGCMIDPESVLMILEVLRADTGPTGDVHEPRVAKRERCRHCHGSGMEPR